jgi:hypothetical protein
MLPKLLFSLTAALYALCTLGRIFSVWKKDELLIQKFSRLEKLAFFVFTAALISYLFMINQGHQENRSQLKGFL